MAKKKNIQLGIDLQVQNYDAAIKALETIEKHGGSTGKAAAKLRQELLETKNSIVALGSTTTPQELKKFIKVNADLADSLVELGKEFKVTQERINQIKKDYAEASTKVAEYTEKLEKAKQKEKELKKVQLSKADLAVKKLNEPGNEGLKEKVKGRSTNQGKLDKLNELKRGDDEKARKFIEELNNEYNQQEQELAEVRKEIKDYKKDIDECNESIKNHIATLNQLKTQNNVYQSIRQSADEAADSINENNDALIRTRDAAVKAGEGQIKIKKTTDETATSFGRAARSVFNYTILYQGLKKILRESVRTIKEMDDAITGMTVVTDLNREEAWQQVEAFQAIAKATSSTMTEIAGLTTEYLKQGRAMKDAKILAEETAKSAKIAGISTAEAVQYMTSAINGFNLAASDATRVSDVFANLAAASATDFEDLAIAVSKVSAQANLAGMSLEYTTALLAKGIETTQEAPESIGTALKTIVARMRELSSYGSVLEDGASVNKVERALASAGIELRNVNGEFRDLEDIFSELGPKWDYLNTMQQQAIAQAVAGTRQQSRFVAIMQDWGRTQELIADANASEGASAAQYAEYAKGIEAALTRMKTSWEGFVQGLANNKIIITGINIATKLIELLNKTPDTLKVIIALYASWMVLHKARENHEIKMKAYRQMAMTDEEKLNQSKKGILEQQLKEKENEKQIISQMKTKLELAKKIQEQTLKNNPQLDEYATSNDLDLVKNKKAGLKKKLSSPDLTDSARLDIQKQINALTKEEEALSKKLSDYRLDKEEQRKKVIDDILNKQKDLDKAKVKLDITSAIEDISKLDKEIDELSKKRKKATGEDKTAIENEIKTKKAERSSKIKETKESISNSDLDDTSRTELLDQLKNKDTRKNATSSEANANYNALQKERISLSEKINDTVTYGTEQWNAKLQDSKTKLLEIQEQLKNTSLTDEERNKLKEAETLELEKQRVIQMEINKLQAQKDNAGKEIEAIDSNIEKLNTEKESEGTSSERKIKIEEELKALSDERAAKVKLINDLEYGQIGLLDEKIAKEEKLEALKAAKENELKEVQGTIASGTTTVEFEDGTKLDLLAQEKQLKAEIALIDTQASELQQQINNANISDIENLNTAKELKASALKDEQTLADLKAYQMTASEEALVRDNEAQIKKLEGLNEEIRYRKELLKLEINELKAKKDAGTLTGKEAKLLKQKEKNLKKLNKREQTNAKSIFKLNQKNQKLQDGTYNIYSKMADLIGNKIGVNLKGMADDIKTAVTFTKTLVTDFVKFLGQIALRKKIEKDTTKEMEKQSQEKSESAGTDLVSLATNKLQEEVEEDTTKEVEQQHRVTQGATLLEKVQLAVAKLMGKEEKKETMEDTTQVALEAGESIAEAGEQGASMNFAGMAIGIAGAVAALALAGIGAAVSLGSGAGGAGGSQSKEDKIAGKQTANYNMKKSNATANKALDEYTELQNKEFKTEEDKQRLEELESEMQELDEHFAGLKGDALVKAVRGRVAAQEVAIADNIKDSFDTALSMDDINGSNVARQAIADKIISSQEKLIASNVDLVDATEKEVEAVKNNAADMASEISKQMDWNSYGNAHDYNAWDYVGAAAGTLLLGSFLNPVAGILGGGAGIAAMIAEDKAAEEQQKKMEEDIAKFERASVEMAAEMATADEDLASQVAAFDSGLAELTNSLDGVADTFKQTAKEIVKEQYGTVAYVSELNAATNGELLNTISRIQEKTKGTVTEDAMLKMADAVAGSSLEDQKILEKLKAAENTSYGSTSEGWAFFSGTNQSQNLDSLRENLKDTLGDNYKNATINEIKEALTAQIKRNDDGTLKVDKNGNYAFKDVGNGFTGNNKELTEIFNNIANLSEELGDFANLSSEAAGYLTDWTSALTSSKDLLINAFQTIDENLYSNEELLGDTLTEHQKETGNAGYAFAKAAQETADTIKREGQAQIDKLIAQQKEKEVGSEAYNALQQAIDKIRTDMNSNAADVLAQAKQAVGYLSDSDWLNRVENLQSKRDNIQDIREAFINKEDLTVEQTQRLWNEIIPDLQKLDPSLGYAELKKIFDEQGLEAVGLLSKYLDDFKENSNLIALNSVGSDLADVDYALQQLTSAGKDLSSWGLTYTTDKDGNKVIDAASLDNVDQQVIADEIKKYKDENDGKAPEWTDEYNKLLETLATYWSHKDQQEASQVAFEREATLTTDEIKRANLEAKIASVSEDSSKHRLSVLELEIDLHKQLADELATQVANKQKIITDDLDSLGVNFDDIFKIVNGQVEIVADKYENLSDDVKEYITMNIDGLKDIVAAEYEERKAVIDGEKEKFEEIINLQETMIDAYKSKLEEEQEAVEETLDKRKELYQEYFDWLNDQEDQDEQENDIETLRERIANLSGATDAASLKALKEAQEELADLEKESIQSEQEKIQEQILENLDKQSEQVEEYYNQQLEDNQAIINAIRDMPQNMVLEMLRQADGYYNLTEEQKAQKDQEYQQLLDGWQTSNGATLDGTVGSVVTEEPEVEVETTTTTTDTTENASSTTIHSTIHKKNKPLIKQVEAYADGGLVDYTGPAWVDGTPGKPEAFLNAEQTALFGKLGETLVAMSSQGVFGKLNDISASTINNNLTIENFDITINADMKDDQDLYETGNNLADVFFERIQASGIPVNIKK